MSGKVQEYIFEENRDSRIQHSFSSIEDSIVEPGLEVYEVFLTSNEPLVKISPTNNIQNLFILDDDGGLSIKIILCFHTNYHSMKYLCRFQNWFQGN